MNQKKYIKQILKRLKCSKTRREEIRKELDSDISEALAQGETITQIIQRMGNPYSVAQEFNENFSETEIKAAKRRKTFRILAIVCAVILVLGFGVYFILPKYQDINQSKVFQVNQVKSTTETVISLVSQNQYETLNDQYYTNAMKKIDVASKIADAKNMLNINDKSFTGITAINVSQMSQMGQTCAVVEATAQYGDKSIIYTLCFTEDYKLSALYMR